MPDETSYEYISKKSWIESNSKKYFKIKDDKCCLNDIKSKHSQTVGKNGPVLVQDGILHETLETFVNSKTIERAVHVKGYGAFGHFKLYNSMKNYTTACFLQTPNSIVPTFVRFSQAGGQKGTPDTLRNIRGFATRFYTKEGIFDIVGNHIPVFFVRDAIKFPETIDALSPSSVNNLTNPEKFWSFVSRNPEAIHAVLWFYSDVGTVNSYRHIKGYGVNTFVWRNSDNITRYVKYHWIPLAGEKYITRQEAIRLAGENPDIAGKDLYDTLENGEPVEYELYVQLMNPTDECKLSFDPLDDTKVWDENQYPLIPVGLLSLEKNPTNYEMQVEKAAFSPANLIDGIELSNDKMLQGRSFAYWDAQRYRLGRNFRNIPINCNPNWSIDKSIITSGNCDYVAGKQIRSEINKTDNFSQAGIYYNSLSDTQKNNLIDNIASELYLVSNDAQTTF